MDKTQNKSDPSFKSSKAESEKSSGSETPTTGQKKKLTATKEPYSNQHQEVNAGKTNVVAILVGKWAIPATVVLVIITCLSGFYLTEAAFTPVVGMIAPVVMALIMVIKEASVGKDEDPAVQDRENERKERIEQYRHEKEVRLAQMELEERLKNQEVSEQARQFDTFHQSTREFVALVKDMNSRLANQLEKQKSTELAIGDTRIKISDGDTTVESSDKDELKRLAEEALEIS